MAKYLFAGSAQGKNWFITKKENCNIVVFWERIPEGAKSGASPYVKMGFYEKSPRMVTVVHHSDHGEDEARQWMAWNRIWQHAQPKLVERMVVVETPRVIAEAPVESRAASAEMLAKIKFAQQVADIERQYRALLVKHRIAWSKAEKDWLRDNQSYVPVELRKRLKEALTGRKVESSKVCPF